MHRATRAMAVTAFLLLAAFVLAPSAPAAALPVVEPNPIPDVSGLSPAQAPVGDLKLLSAKDVYARFQRARARFN